MLQSMQPAEGLQLFIELIDLDEGESSNDLIDRFATDISNEAGSTNLPGLFQFAQIGVNYRVSCLPDSTAKSYACDPGFTGVCCATKIANCSIGSGSGTEESMPGSGQSCPTHQVDTDACDGVDCNGGTCVRQQEMAPNFRCECPPRYTGQLCETKLNTTVLSVGITSYNNPEGQCADAVCSENQCCRGHCPSRCNYFLYFCLRPAHTQVSNKTGAFQGGDSATICAKTGTDRRGPNSQSFYESDAYFLGIPNPWRFEKEQWVSDAISKSSLDPWSA